MYSFRNDYSEGAHPAVLRALEETNLTQSCGYGLDPYCAKAAATIRALCGDEEADVHFVVGGTQANLLVIHAFLRSYEAVIAAHTGHVNVHETGAIEATGHKVCTAPSPDGKVSVEMVEAIVASHSSEHMVHPRLVYISDTTETGTVYTKAELTALRQCCDRHGLLLYLDGARLGCALTIPGADVTLADLAGFGRKGGGLDAQAEDSAGITPLKGSTGLIETVGEILAAGGQTAGSESRTQAGKGRSLDDFDPGSAGEISWEPDTGGKGTGNQHNDSLALDEAVSDE